MAYIRKRGDLQWQVEIRKKGFPTVSKTLNTKAEAEAWAAVRESEMVRGVFVDTSEAEKTSLGDLIDSFLKDYAPYEYKQRADGKEAYKYQCANIKERLGKFSLASIDQKLVGQYRDDRLNDFCHRNNKRTQKVKKVSGSTVKKELNMLSKLMGYAEIEKGIVLPRGNVVKKVRAPQDGEGRDRRLTEEEWIKLEEECRASRNRSLRPVSLL